MTSIASNGNNNSSTENTPNNQGDVHLSDLNNSIQVANEAKNNNLGLHTRDDIEENKSLQTELTFRKKKLEEAEDKFAALGKEIKRLDEERQKEKNTILKLKREIFCISTNTKSINTIINAIVVPRTTHDAYSEVVHQIHKFLTEIIKTKCESFSSVAKVFKGGSWKKDTDINLNKIKKLPNSDIDLVIMLNGPDKDSFDWVKDYAEELKQLFISNYEQIQSISYKDNLGDGIFTSKHGIKFDHRLLDIKSHVHIDLLISPNFTRKELMDKVEEFKDVPDKLKFLTKALTEKQTENIKTLCKNSPDAKTAIRFLKCWKFFIWKEKKKSNQPSSYFIECIIHDIYMENKQASMYEYIKSFFVKVSNGRLYVKDVACEYNDVAKDLTDIDWGEIKGEGLKMKTDKGIAAFIDQVKKSKLFDS